MTSLPASKLRVLSRLRALATCLIEEREAADALVEMVLVSAWNIGHSLARKDLETLLFSIMHREFHGYECAGLRADAPDRIACLLQPDMGSSCARSVLRALPPVEREAILLVEACGLSQAEAAAICECDLWTFRRRLQNASELLAKQLRAVSKPAPHLWLAS